MIHPLRSLISKSRYLWVSCQFEVLWGTLPRQIPRALGELPVTLHETYERILKDIDNANWENVRRLFQSVAVASRPLRVEELAEFLAFDYDAGSIPIFRADLRPDNPVDTVLSMCSSLL